MTDRRHDGSPKPLTMSAEAPTEELAPSPLDDLEPSFDVAASEVAVCVDDTHPVMAGRVRCKFERPSGPELHWIPCLLSVRPRVGDRVLVQRAVGLSRGVVAGVIDGYRPRLDPEPRASHVRAIREDEAIRIEADDGTPLVEVRTTATGPVVRVLTRDVAIETPGKLAITADAIELRARQGGVKVAASEDVVVTGEEIHLN
jgi:hypothetical protein